MLSVLLLVGLISVAHCSDDIDFDSCEHLNRGVYRLPCESIAHFISPRSRLSLRVSVL